ncbi:MAG: DUF3365 domain-containing protein [Thiovulaceae bacterium]|nr:DUF3365 domain-containing protein [Sulfurimonadaceae bacterium]
MKRLALIALFSAALTASPYESSQKELDAVVKTGQELSAALISTLGKNLKQQMKDGGPLAAAKFCSTKAYALTAEIGEQSAKEVQLKRISLKERNPANQAEGEERVILQSLEKLQQSGVILPEYLVERVNNDTYKYYKPLIINKQICLKCHGDISRDVELSQFFEKSYPHDKARGYKFGDLRGAVVITVKR